MHSIGWLTVNEPNSKFQSDWLRWPDASRIEAERTFLGGLEGDAGQPGRQSQLPRADELEREDSAEEVFVLTRRRGSAEKDPDWTATHHLN
jgi:hypothetical protein